MVWDRIAEQIGPPPRLLARIATWIGPPPLVSVPSTPFWVSLRGVTLLGMAVIGMLALVNPPAGLLTTGLERSPGARATVVDFGLTEPELAIQPAFGRRPVDLTLPSASVAGVSLLSPARTRVPERGALQLRPPREAYNRGVWLRPVPEPRFGPVMSPAALSGRYQ